MKTSASARYFVKIRVIIVCAALAALAEFEVFISESLAARISQTSARQADSPATPNLSISDLMAAAR
jgi:hypothetical protein